MDLLQVAGCLLNRGRLPPGQERDVGPRLDLLPHRQLGVTWRTRLGPTGLDVRRPGFTASFY